MQQKASEPKLLRYEWRENNGIIEFYPVYSNPDAPGTIIPSPDLVLFHVPKKLWDAVLRKAKEDMNKTSR